MPARVITATPDLKDPDEILLELRNLLIEFRSKRSQLAKALGQKYSENWPDLYVDWYEYAYDGEVDRPVTALIANADEILLKTK
jgi:hypothetical protein